MQVQGTGSSNLASAAQRSGSALKKTNRELQKILERLSTATRINRASDDAAGLSISEQLRSQIRGFKMATQNISDATSALNIADSAANEVSSMVQRQRELALAARNDTLNDTDRVALDKEYLAITEEIGRISQTAQFNRQSVAAGTELTSGDAQIQAGPNAGDQIAIPRADLAAIRETLQETSIADTEKAAAAISALDASIKSLNSERSIVGAATNMLGSAANSIAVALTNSQAAESALRDEDIASGLSQLTKLRLLQEGNVRAFARFNDISRNHLLGLLSE